MTRFSTLQCARARAPIDNIVMARTCSARSVTVQTRATRPSGMSTFFSVRYETPGRQTNPRTNERIVRRRREKKGRRRHVARRTRNGGCDLWAKRLRYFSDRAQQSHASDVLARRTRVAKNPLRDADYKSRVRVRRNVIKRPRTGYRRYTVSIRTLG